jgi:thymidylate synthase
MVFQRSCDLVLGANFNVAEYALLTHIIAKLVNMTPKRLIWVGGDVHIYHNAIDAAKEMITREPYSPPKLVIADRGQTKVEDFELSDFTIENYKYHPGIQIEVAV